MSAPHRKLELVPASLLPAGPVAEGNDNARPLPALPLDEEPGAVVALVRPATRAPDNDELDCDVDESLARDPDFATVCDERRGRWLDALELDALELDGDLLTFVIGER